MGHSELDTVVKRVKKYVQSNWLDLLSLVF